MRGQIAVDLCRGGTAAHRRHRPFAEYLVAEHTIELLAALDAVGDKAAGAVVDAVRDYLACREHDEFDGDDAAAMAQLRARVAQE